MVNEAAGIIAAKMHAKFSVFGNLHFIIIITMKNIGKVRAPTASR